MMIKNKNILVVGLGRSGIAMCRFLKRAGASVTITDKAKAEELGEFFVEADKMDIRMEIGGHSAESFARADLIVLSPGVPHTILPVKTAIEKGMEVIGEIEFASRFIKEPIIAITGTNGKTTTTKLLGEMLKDSGKSVFVGGNIGNPLIEYVEKEDKSEFVVAEVSSFQLDTIKQFKPKISVLLNITEDHLDRYPDFEAYARSKCRIFENQNKDDTAVLNGSDPFVRKMCQNIGSKKLFFNDFSKIEWGAEIADNNITIASDRKAVFEVASPSLSGRHNLENTAAACLAALSAGGTIEGIQNAIDRFVGFPHRIEHVATHNDIQYFDDSKATNVDAVARALENFKTPVILIMGGRDKGGDYSVLNALITKHVKQIIVMGEAKQKITHAFSDIVSLEAASSMEEAVALANKVAVPGDSVLLSPACSSFDMFESYGHRGNVFKAEVERLKRNSK